MLELTYAQQVAIFGVGFVTSMITCIYITLNYFKFKDKDPFEN